MVIVGKQDALLEDARVQGLGSIYPFSQPRILVRGIWKVQAFHFIMFAHSQIRALSNVCCWMSFRASDGGLEV